MLHLDVEVHWHWGAIGLIASMISAVIGVPIDFGLSLSRWLFFDLSIDFRGKFDRYFFHFRFKRFLQWFNAVGQVVFLCLWFLFFDLLILPLNLLNFRFQRLAQFDSLTVIWGKLLIFGVQILIGVVPVEWVGVAVGKINHNSLLLWEKKLIKALSMLVRVPKSD